MSSAGSAFGDDFSQWKLFWRERRVPYWIQRADFSSKDYRPATFKRGLARRLSSPVRARARERVIFPQI